MLSTAALQRCTAEKRLRRPAGFFLLAALALACAAVAAAEPTLPQITVTGIQEPPNARLVLDTPSLTGSRLGLTPRETAATINIVERETIDERGARDTQEVLSGMPGIIADAPPGGGGAVSMRGFNRAQITQLFNGIDVAYIIAAHPVDAWLLDRVEVLGGASGFLYGQGAVGGSINYVSKLATRQPLQHDTLVRAGSFGTYQAAYGINGTLGGSKGRHHVRADLSHQGTDGHVERTDGRSTVFAGSWLADPTPRLSHTLAYEYQTKEHQPYWGTPVLNPIRDGRINGATRFKNYNAADGAYGQTVQWLRSILAYRISGKTRITNTLYHYDAERDYRNVETYRFNPDNTRVTRSNALLQKHVHALVGNRIEWLHQGTLGHRPSISSVGLDFSRNKQTRFPRSISGTISTVDPIDFSVENFFQIPGMVEAHQPDRTNRVFTQALYAENLTRLAPKWRLLSGLRMERIKVDAVNFRAASAANPAYFERRYNPVTGRLGLMHDITPTANVYVSYSTAADPPAGILTTTNYGAIRDWDLTTGKQLEVGSKFEFLNGRGNGTVAAYQIGRKNLSMPDPDNSANSLPIGQQSSRGIEAQAGILLTPRWSVQGNAAWVWAKYDRFTQVVGGASVSRDGYAPTFVPDRVANLFVTWRFAPGWSAAGVLRHVSAQWGNVDNTQRFPGYTLFDASLAYKIARHSTLVLRGRNLGNELYVASGGGGQVRLGEPRAFEVSLRSSF